MYTKIASYLSNRAVRACPIRDLAEVLLNSKNLGPIRTERGRAIFMSFITLAGLQEDFISYNIDTGR